MLKLFQRSKRNIYHCCVQKTASQWFAYLFADTVIKKKSKLSFYRPKANFIPQEPEVLNKLQIIPTGVIVSPLYIRYEDFLKMRKPKSYRAFFVMRDPRDLIISDYFSLKYSHATIHPYIMQMREKLNGMPEQEGILERIHHFKSYYETLRGWMRSTENEKIQIVKYEDVFVNKPLEAMGTICQHCEIDLSEVNLQALLDKFSFKKLSGREPGRENAQSHYRKGVAGDWKNYFSPEHKQVFKGQAGDLLIKLGYEKNMEW